MPKQENLRSLPGCLGPLGRLFRPEKEPVQQGPWQGIRASEERRLGMTPACLPGGPEGLVDRRGKRFFSWNPYRTLTVTEPSKLVIYHLGEIREMKAEGEQDHLEIQSLEPMVYFYLPLEKVSQLSVDLGGLTVRTVVPQPGNDLFAPVEESGYDFCDWEGSETARFWLLSSSEGRVMAIVFSWIDKETRMCRLTPVVTGASGDLNYERKLMIRVIQKLASEEKISGFYAQAKEGPMVKFYGTRTEPLAKKEVATQLSTTEVPIEGITPAEAGTRPVIEEGLGFKEVYPRVRRSRVILKENLEETKNPA